MNGRPSASFFAVASIAVALAVAALVLSVQTEDSAYAAAAGVIGAIGCFVAARMLKGEQR
jgi:hypothetical protein